MEFFFTVIIPTLNEEQYLPKLLEDLKNQKEKNFEVVIVDGASADKTKIEALKYAQYMTLSFFDNDKKNVSWQRNFGAAKAKGHYLIFLDADSRINSGFTRKLQDTILKKKGLVFVPYSLPDDKSPQAKFIYKLSNFLIELSQSTTKPFSNGGNMILESNFFRLIGGFNEKLYLAEDHDILNKAAAWGVKTKFLNQVKFTNSLRRARNEGQLALYYKYLVATAYLLLKGDIKKKIFKYEMGGAVEKKLKDKATLNENLQKYLKQTREFFKNLS